MNLKLFGIADYIDKVIKDFRGAIELGESLSS